MAIPRDASQPLLLGPEGDDPGAGVGGVFDYEGGPGAVSGGGHLSPSDEEVPPCGELQIGVIPRESINGLPDPVRAGTPGESGGLSDAPADGGIVPAFLEGGPLQ